MAKNRKETIVEINVLLEQVREKIAEEWKGERLLLRISDTQNPPRTRREDIEGDIQGLAVE
jgi:hypothetical protein